MNLTLESISSSRAKLHWQKPVELKAFFGYSLLVEEIVMDRESFRDVKLIHPDVFDYLVVDLSPATRYRATLKALEEGDRVLRTETVEFQTLDISGKHDKYNKCWLKTNYRL